MNIIDKSFKLAARANKREKQPVFCHLTYRGVTMDYKHKGTYAQPVYMVNNGSVYNVTRQSFDGIASCYERSHNV